MKKRLSKITNKRVLKILYNNIKNYCIEDLDAMKQISDSFGFKNLLRNSPLQNIKLRDKRQIAIVATIVITSLITYFSTKELVQMSQADDDELLDSTNHNITAVQYHENRISRLEIQQTQLKDHLQKLTDQMVLGIKI